MRCRAACTRDSKGARYARRQLSAPADWTRRCVLNVARMGRFSSDRTVWEYAMDIWKVQPTPSEVLEAAVAG